MDRVNDDVLWRILQWLLPLEACATRAVAYRFKTVVDAVPQHEWRRIFHERVCDCLNVGDAFDWRRAGCLASTRDGIKALCLWNYKSVFLITPWTHPYATLESPLKSGVRREPICDITAIDFVYDDTFRLRGMAQTCLRRNEGSMCANCRTNSKRRCQNLQYRYFLREMPSLSANEHAFNECLGLRLATQSYGF